MYLLCLLCSARGGGSQRKWGRSWGIWGDGLAQQPAQAARQARRTAGATRPLSGASAEWAAWARHGRAGCETGPEVGSPGRLAGGRSGLGAGGVGTGPAKRLMPHTLLLPPQVLDHVPLLLYILAAKTLILCLAFAGAKIYQRKRLEARERQLEAEKSGKKER